MNREKSFRIEETRAGIALHFDDLALKGEHQVESAVRQNVSPKASCCACAGRHKSKICCVSIVLLGAAVLVLHLMGYLRKPPPPPVACTGVAAGCSVFDATNWTRALHRHTRSQHTSSAGGAVSFTAVDYAGMASDADFAAFLRALESTDVTRLNRTSQQAFFINAYNAFTVRMVIEHPCQASSPRWCSSITDISENGGLKTVWKMSAGVIGGRTYTLDNIEHDTLRKQWDDARVHAALVCASISCPDIRQEAFELEHGTIDRALDEQMAVWLANDQKGLAVSAQPGAGAAHTVTVSKIFDWYGGDFKPSVADVLSRHCATIWRAAVEAASSFEYFSYNWQLNDWDRSAV